MMQEVQSFGQWVRERRKYRHLTQSALGRLIGYAEVTIRQIEHDKYNLTRFAADSVVNCLAGEQEDREALVRFALRQTSDKEQSALSLGMRPPATPFFGRTAELATLRDLLDNPECRCVSIVGVGGIGKTRLAMRAIDEFVNESSLAAWVVNLATITTEALLPTVVAQALDIAITPFGSPLDQLLLAIRSKELLLVLDNFEQLLPDGSRFVLAILERAPQVKVVITSRERLRISAEWCIQLRGLDTSDQPVLSEAAQLFINTAQRINREFDASDSDAIQDICRAALGIPLAVEMAASWTEVYSCRDILADISTRILGLASRQRDIDERHRTLQAVFEATWLRLSPSEQDSLKKLATFRGGFTLDAASRVAGVNHASLAFLQDKMLVQPQSRGRYVMHDMVHQFALHQLANNDDELLQAKLIHAAYFVEVFQQSLPGLRYRRSQQEVKRLLPDMENLQAAWEMMVRQGKVDWFLAVWETLFLLTNFTSRFQEGEAAFRLASSAFHVTEGSEIEAFIRAFSQSQCAELLFRQGRIPEACELQFAPEVQAARTSGDPLLRRWFHLNDSCLYFAIGDGLQAMNYSAASYGVSTANLQSRSKLRGIRPELD